MPAAKPCCSVCGQPVAGGHNRRTCGNTRNPASPARAPSPNFMAPSTQTAPQPTAPNTIPTIAPAALPAENESSNITLEEAVTWWMLAKPLNHSNTAGCDVEYVTALLAFKQQSGISDETFTLIIEKEPSQNRAMIELDPRIPPRVLAFRAQRGNRETWHNIMANPAATADTIRYIYNLREKLAATTSPDTAVMMFTKHANTPSDVLDSILNGNIGPVNLRALYNLTASPHLSTRSLNKIVKKYDQYLTDSSAWEYFDMLTLVANHPNVSSATLDFLARIPKTFNSGYLHDTLIAAVVRNPHTTKKTLSFIKKSTHEKHVLNELAKRLPRG